MDTTDWQPVTDAAGNVLGWMAAPDPDEDPHGDLWSEAREAWLGLRAEAVELLGDPVFDLDAVWESGRQSGLSEDDLDAACGLALELWRVEHGD